MGFEVFGVSGRKMDDRIEFARRVNLPYELLNDSDFELTSSLRLPTFEFQSIKFVKRLAVVVRRSVTHRFSTRFFHRTRTLRKYSTIF